MSKMRDGNNVLLLVSGVSSAGSSRQSSRRSSHRGGSTQKHSRGSSRMNTMGTPLGSRQASKGGSRLSNCVGSIGRASSVFSSTQNLLPPINNSQPYNRSNSRNEEALTLNKRRMTVQHGEQSILPFTMHHRNSIDCNIDQKNLLQLPGSVLNRHRNSIEEIPYPKNVKLLVPGWSAMMNQSNTFKRRLTV